MNIMMPLIMKAISIIFFLVFILSVALMVLTFRKPRKISVLSLILAVLVSLATLVIFSFLVHYEPSMWLLSATALAGFFIGLVWSQTTRVYVENGTVMSRNSIWYLVVWGGVFALTQLISIITNRPPPIIMALLMMSTATIIGMNGSIIKKYFSMKASIAQPGTFPRKCRSCGAALVETDAFCSRCGQRL